MRRSKAMGLSVACLSVLMVACAILVWAPLRECPACSGVGRISVMASHPEAMGSEKSAGSLVEIGCPTCNGKTRVTLVLRD